MGRIQSPHDTFFRGILADKEVASDYFKAYLPTFVTEKLDFDTLVQTGESYISKQLKESFSDVVFTCKLKEGERQVKVSLLIEHKSYIDKYTPIQLGSYIFSGLQKQLDNREKLSIIIPILFYHGEERWEYKDLSGLFNNPDPDWDQYVPNFSYVYNNLWEMSDEQLEALSNQFLTASLLTLKHFKQNTWLEENATKIFIKTRDVPENLLELLIVYFLQINKSDEPKFIEIFESIPEALKDKIMSTYDMLIEKGEKRGFEKGFEKAQAEYVKNMLLKGFAEEVICDTLGVKSEFVKTIAETLK
ncbi:Rpn family recombination-promoting nuclease/putative transposase [Dyadobacter sp. LHD-138]|uniref:Rpn family recombination-promoting nuclease/putative transposase n=1 Tax=Dyadobacter sp. LHD-138 TaxID=3071413 RepID=UPI0027DEF147|nr:Rpn family recombination-promoting nuclease/putative transposase [Dyadobacter sp. LHD-138]MDQ6481367.1 Rpn family recombination-promoting nuclease/putative transposase [Dyadobacter sp. LHD-138]